MNDTPVERLARTFHLTDFADYETAESSFEFLTRLIVWRIKHDERSDPANDELLKRRGEEPFARVSFFLYLATYDPVFFDLAKRMAGYTLERHNPPDRAYCLIAAQLLRMDAPKQKKHKSTRDAVIVIAVAVAEMLGLKPNAKVGGCSRLKAELETRFNVCWSLELIEKVWRQKEDKLLDLEFSDHDISVFLDSCKSALDK